MAIAATENQAHNVSVTITNPPGHNQTVLTKSIIINGTATVNGGSGIQIVEAYVAKLPFNGSGDYRPTKPVAAGNWSKWSFPIFLNDSGSYLVKARVTSNAGDQNWADVTIDLPEHVYNKKVAFIEPTFTYAAYRTRAFYDFYDKYSFKDAWSANKTITTDLNLLRDRPIPHGPFPYYAHPTFSDIPYIHYFNVLLQHVQKYMPSPVTRMTDVDVHQGKIFQADGRNAYDVLFLFHNEYLTSSEYNNLRQFVSNGGNIVFTEGNILYAEVSYNKSNDSITLLKGHNWNVNGSGATRGIAERWLNENKEWMGSNFWVVPSNVTVNFRNNPFNYTHTEEQYVTNPKAKILINYETTYSSQEYPNPTIATYYMDYGKGRVINLGIWGHMVADNKAFLSYFDNTIIPLALGSPLDMAQKNISSKLNVNIRDNTSTSSIHTTRLPPVVAEAADASGAVVNYSLPSALNNTNAQSGTECKPPSGSVFPIGNTAVKCISKHNNNNATTEMATFAVEVLEPSSPFFFNPGS